MENERVKTLDGAVELSLRALCILYESDRPMTKDRISAYDYFSLYTRDMDNSQENLLSEMQLRSTSYLGEIQTITKAMSILISRDLITYDVASDEVEYRITEVGQELVKELSKNEYAKRLFEHIHQVNTFFKCYTADELNAFVKTHITNWKEEVSL